MNLGKRMKQFEVYLVNLDSTTGIEITKTCPCHERNGIRIKEKYKQLCLPPKLAVQAQ